MPPFVCWNVEYFSVFWSHVELELYCSQIMVQVRLNLCAITFQVTYHSIAGKVWAKGKTYLNAIMLYLHRNMQRTFIEHIFCTWFSTVTLRDRFCVFCLSIHLSFYLSVTLFQSKPIFSYWYNTATSNEPTLHTVLS